MASQLETVHELVRRGLVDGTDEVSVDGGPYQRIDAVDGALPPGSDAPDDPVDPWRHWNDAREGEEQGLLSDFLDGIGGGPAARPPPSREPPRRPPDLAPPEELPVEAVAPMGSPIAAPVELEAHELEPLSEPAEPSKRAALTFVEPEPEGPSATVSFKEWVGQRGDDDAGALLRDFGRVDDGIVIGAANRRGINWWRVGGLVLLSGVGILFWHTWVRTIAGTNYPTEAELVAKVQGDGPAVAGGVTGTSPTPKEPATPSVRDAERRLRAQVVGDIVDFANVGALENGMFQELSNLRVRPVSVRVVASRLVGPGNFQADRPIEATLTVSLAGVSPEQGDLTEVLQERLLLAWLVVGKYSSQGRVAFSTVTVVFGAPSPLRYAQDGRKLVAVWTGKASATDLLLEPE